MAAEVAAAAGVAWKPIQKFILNWNTEHIWTKCMKFVLQSWKVISDNFRRVSFLLDHCWGRDRLRHLHNNNLAKNSGNRMFSARTKLLLFQRNFFCSTQWQTAANSIIIPDSTDHREMRIYCWTVDAITDILLVPWKGFFSSSSCLSHFSPG